jgi:hypothetical protein
MSIQSAASVRPFIIPALAALTKEERSFRNNNRRNIAAHNRTILDYKRVARERPLTEIEKQDLHSAIEIERQSETRFGGWAVQVGIDCGVYALRSLVHCA